MSGGANDSSTKVSWSILAPTGNQKKTELLPHFEINCADRGRNDDEEKQFIWG